MASIPQRSAPSFERFAAIRLFGTVGYSPDGRWLAYLANTSGQHNLWRLPVGGGFARQLTAFDERRVTDFAWHPSGERIAFAADRHGDEMHQIFVVDVDPESGRADWPVQITDDPDVQYGLAGWTPDGDRIVASGNDREPTEVDAFLLDPATGDKRRLMTGGLYYAVEVSPDGRWLVVLDVRGNTDQDLHLVDLDSGEATLCTAHEGNEIYWPGPWLRDSSGFYLRTNAGREFAALAVYRLEDRAWRTVHAPDRDVEDVVVSRDGRVAVAAENVDGASRVVAYDLTRGEDVRTPDLGLGVIAQLALHPTGERAALVLARPTEAANLVEIDLALDDAAPDPLPPRALEQSMLGGIDPARLAIPEPIRYPSFDRDIPAWLYRPEGEGPHPMVLSIHGGPEDQERPGYAYTGLYQFLLSRGIGVLAPNIRGSYGYGITYQELIHRDWGGGELRDIEHAALWLRAQPWVDDARVAVFGGSFGGFATLSALTRLPDYWALGVDIVGPSNLVTLVETVPPHWRSLMDDMIGSPTEDRALLEERSPITYVDRIRAPLLILQGANDPRVPQAESDQMVERMRANGLEVEYYVDPEGGHGAANREGTVRWMAMVADYLERGLVGD